MSRIVDWYRRRRWDADLRRHIAAKPTWGGDYGVAPCDCPCDCDGRGTYPAMSPRCYPCTEAGWLGWNVPVPARPAELPPELR